jgi:DNA-directed RNA polymerase subunit RPC12/RpoP
MSFLSKFVGRKDIACPHCGARLTEMPERRKKCPHCGKVMVPKTRPSDRKRVLVTPEQAQQIEAEWQEGRTRWAAERISELAREAVQAAKKGDWGEAKLLYHQHAVMLLNEGKEFVEAQRLGREAELRYEAARGVKQVKIVGQSACEVCKPFDGKVVAVDAELRSPTLPVSGCLGQNGDRFCRCWYSSYLG